MRGENSYLLRTHKYSDLCFKRDGENMMMFFHFHPLAFCVDVRSRNRNDFSLSVCLVRMGGNTFHSILSERVVPDENGWVAFVCIIFFFSRNFYIIMIADCADTKCQNLCLCI